MSLKVIGAGFGRTGTHSLKLALEQLGFAPCYHMSEVFTHPTHPALWERVADGETDLLPQLLDGFEAAVDWPVCNFWRTLAAQYPDAKFLLTERDPERWFESISQTIFAYMAIEAMADDPMRGPQWRMGRKLVRDQAFGGNLDKDHVLAVYEAHNAAVKAELGDRVLVYRPGDGWEPLCTHLDVPVPGTPYPRTNSTEEFRQHVLA